MRHSRLKESNGVRARALGGGPTAVCASLAGTLAVWQSGRYTGEIIRDNEVLYSALTTTRPTPTEPPRSTNSRYSQLARAADANCAYTGFTLVRRARRRQRVRMPFVQCQKSRISFTPCFTHGRERRFVGVLGGSLSQCRRKGILLGGVSKAVQQFCPPALGRSSSP